MLKNHFKTAWRNLKNHKEMTTEHHYAQDR